MFCRPRGLAQQLLIQGKYVSKQIEYFLLEMHDEIIHNPRGHSVSHIRPRDYLLTPWMVQLTPGIGLPDDWYFTGLAGILLLI